MKDSKLWKEESDHYSSRAKANLGDVYAHYDQYAVNKCIQLLNAFQVKPARVLDLGCAYGAFTHHLSKSVPANYYGVDPGAETIKFAMENVSGPNVVFQQGYGHDLPYDNGFFDVVVLNMVLQWVPRQHLIRTLSEIDRVMNTSAVLFVQEFEPRIPKYSASAHSPEIFIFKDHYERLFTAFPWLSLLHKESLYEELGDDYQKVIFFIRKLDLDKAYTLKKWD